MSATSHRTPRYGSCTTTNGFVVSVVPVFDSRESQPQERRYLFRYTITIENTNEQPAALRSRRWLIKDADANVYEVDGEGVVGLQPVIGPGEKFTYSSFCPLHTTWGTMEGVFRMVSADRQEFEINIGRFYLVYPPPEHNTSGRDARSAGVGP